jgi:Protein of unknown function (DUF3761)
MSVRIATLIAATALAAASIGLAPTAAASPQCGDGPDYVASSGDCVHDPEPASTPPSGATAICQDGDYSFSEHPHSGGTCHGHGGVKQYL